MGNRRNRDGYSSSFKQPASQNYLKKKEDKSREKRSCFASLRLLLATRILPTVDLVKHISPVEILLPSDTNIIASFIANNILGCFFKTFFSGSKQ